MIHQRYDLLKIIKYDLCCCGKYSLILLCLFIITALFIVIVTYTTKQMVMEREQMILEKEVLDMEWRNLIVEETILGSNDRIEKIATDNLHMQCVDQTSERILIVSP